MGKRTFVTVWMVAAVAVGAILFVQQKRVSSAETNAGLESSRVLSAIFTVKNDLRVATLSGDVVARATGCSLNCWVPNGQNTRAPYSVDYFVGLDNLPASSFRWNDKDRIMSVDIPDVRPANPSIDMSRGRTQQEGLWISRESGLAMQRQAAGYLAVGASAKAMAPENLNKARESARRAVTRFVQAPLAAAGLPGVRVVVRLPGETRPADISSEQWDVSRSIAEVLADAQKGS